MELDNLGTLLGAILILLIGVRVNQIEEEKKVGTVFIIVTLLYSWMCITWFYLGQTTEPKEALYLRKLQAVWAFTLPFMTLTFYFFARSYGVVLSRKWIYFFIVFLFIPGAIFYYLEWFTAYKHGTMIWVEEGGFWGLSMERDNVATIFRGCWNLLNFSLSALFTFLIIKNAKVQRDRVWLLIIFVVQVVSYTISFYQNYFSPFQGMVFPVDESLNVLITCVLLGFAFSGFKLFHVRPENAMNDIITSMTNWLILTDDQFLIKSYNPAVKEAFQHLPNPLEGELLPEILVVKRAGFPITEILQMEKKEIDWSMNSNWKASNGPSL
ncbi:MAG: hypothetical protein AAF598_03360 [Bacteroidota bacterium]